MSTHNNVTMQNVISSWSRFRRRRNFAPSKRRRRSESVLFPLSFANVLEDPLFA